MNPLDYLVAISPDTWSSIGTAVLTSGILSPVLMAVKKGFKVQKDWLMFGIVITACFGVVAVAYLKDAVTINPVTATALLTVLTNAVYYGIYKPLNKKVLPKAVETWADAKTYKNWKTSQKKAAEEEVPGRVTN